MVGAVAALGVAFVVGSAAVVAVCDISTDVVLMTNMKLGPSVEDASMDNWKYCLGPKRRDQRQVRGCSRSSNGILRTLPRMAKLVSLALRPSYRMTWYKPTVLALIRSRTNSLTFES
jgi:hypothetical protein